MSKPIKNLITQRYQKQFGELEGAVLIDLRGVASNDTNRLRSTLAERGIRITVVKNSLARNAFTKTPLEGLSELLEGPNAVVHGGESVVHVARELVQYVKELPNLQFKGALMDGQLFPAEQMETLSKYPTREEAQAQVVQLLLSPAKNLAGAILGPGGKLAAIIKTIQEKLEKGEPIKA